MWLAVKHMRTNLDAVYDVSVFYEGTVNPKTGVRSDAPQINDFLLGHCRRVHIKVRRIPMGDVPETEELFKPWLHQIFVEKDAMLQPFFTGAEDVDCELASDSSKRVTRNSGTHVNSHDSDTSFSNNQSNNSNMISYERLSHVYGGRKSNISLMETLPSFLIFGASCVVMAWSPWTRRLYVSFLCYGTLGAYGWLAVKNVC